MACSNITLSGIAIDCGGIGGLSKVYIAPVADVSGITFSSATGSTYMMTSGITMESGKKFKEFSFRKGNANFVSTHTHSEQNGTDFISTVLTASFNKMENAKRVEMQSLIGGQVYVIVKDFNGLYWLIGHNSNTATIGETYAYATVNGASGAANADANAYTLTLTAETYMLPFEVSAADMTSIV